MLTAVIVMMMTSNLKLFVAFTLQNILLNAVLGDLIYW